MKILEFFLKTQMTSPISLPSKNFNSMQIQMKSSRFYSTYLSHFIPQKKLNCHFLLPKNFPIKEYRNSTLTNKINRF